MWGKVLIWNPVRVSKWCDICSISSLKVALYHRGGGRSRSGSPPPKRYGTDVQYIIILIGGFTKYNNFCVNSVNAFVSVWVCVDHMEIRYEEALIRSANRSCQHYI